MRRVPDQEPAQAPSVRSMPARVSRPENQVQRFACSHCRHEVYFENVRCERCGHALGFEPSSLRMVALAPQRDGAFRVEGRLSRRSLKYCGNHTHGVCNWLVPDDQGNSLCRACRLNRTIPNLSSAENVAAWAAIEGAKKRLVYSLLRLGLPLDANGGGTTTPLTFDFLAETTTGHFNGVITIDIAEANAVERERQRQWLDESYRSLLGHFRHESGHYYWTRLVDGTRWLEPFRRMFGDERADYAAALARHHAQGPPPGWAANHVTAYASAHPAEDWAETWAHYLHIVDVLDTAVALGIQHPAWRLLRGPGPWFGAFDAYRAKSMQRLVDEWIPFALAMNGLNRSMGHVDFYPFVLSPAAIEKLAFVHQAIAGWRAKHGAAQR